MGAADPRAVLERWASRTDQEVTLPTGTKARVRLPSPEALARNDQLPQELRAMALRFAVGGVRTTGLTTEERLEYVGLQDELTARTLTGLWDEDGEAWVAVQLSVEELRELGLPEQDLTALQAIATRQMTPAQVTAVSLEGLGLLTATQAAAVLQKEAGDTVDGWTRFRGQQGGPGAGTDSAAVREPAQQHAGGAGPSAGAGH